MPYQSTERLTLSRYFPHPSNGTQRQYKALRSYFVERCPTCEVACCKCSWFKLR